MPDTN